MRAEGITARIVGKIAVAVIDRQRATIRRQKDELVTLRRQVNRFGMEAARWEERANTLAHMEEEASWLAAERADRLRELGVDVPLGPAL